MTVSFAGALARAVQSPDPSPDAFVSSIDGGIAVPADPAAWSTSNDALASWVAAVADTVPPVNAAWRARSPLLSAMYREWLSRAAHSPADLGARDAAALDQARAVLVALGERYRTRQRQYDDVRQRVDAARRERRDLRTLLAVQNELARASQAWDAVGGKRAYETAEATVKHLTSRGLDVARGRLAAALDQALGGGAMAQSSPPVQLVPPPVEPRAIWLPCELMLAPDAAPDDAGVMFGAGDLPALWVGDGGGDRQTLAVDPGGLSLAFEWTRCAIDRGDWFDPLLLASRTWWWPGATRADPTAGGRLLSDGARPPATLGDWPLTPMALVFVRRLTLTGDADAIASLIECVRDVNEAGCGSFALRQAGSALAGPRDLHHTAPGIAASDGMTLAAVICRCMPREPDPDPAYLVG